MNTGKTEVRHDKDRLAQRAGDGAPREPSDLHAQRRAGHLPRPRLGTPGTPFEPEGP